jgi:uncharacterized protein
VPKSFSNLRTRYVLLDFAIVIIALSVIFAVVLLATGLEIEGVSKNKIFNLTLSTFLSIGMVVCIAIRLKNSGIKSQYLIGNIPLRKLPWWIMLIVFHGIDTLQHGLTQLTLFLTNLAAPSFVQSEIIKTRESLIYDTDSLALKILFYILVFISTVVVAPLSEEFLFRGIFLHRFSIKWGVSAGIITSSILFGIGHGYLHSIAIGVSSVFVALLYIKIPSLLVPISCHAIHNAKWFISKIITEISGVPDGSDITIKSLWFGLLNIGFALLILFYFLKWPTNQAELPYNVNSQASEQP